MTVYPDDVFISSYPKSGNTWVRFLVGNLVWPHRESNEYETMEALTPDTYWHTDPYIKELVDEDS